VLSTEGGAIIGSTEDPRYPPVREEDLTTLTLRAYHTLLDDAPPYFLAHMPWLLANSAGGHSDERFETAAWYKDRQGATLPVVEALKTDARKDEVRDSKLENRSITIQIITNIQRARLSHQGTGLRRLKSNCE